jgi:hypothetical protein
MVQEPITGKGGKGGSDVWDINFGDLLSRLHLADAPITGFILAADMTNGEAPSSDPYLLLSAGSGVNVPEPSAGWLLIAGLALVLGCVSRRAARPN